MGEMEADSYLGYTKDFAVNLKHTTGRELLQLKLALDKETKRRGQLPTEEQILKALANFKKSDACKAIQKRYKDIKKEIALLTKTHTIINVPLKITLKVTTYDWQNNNSYIKDSSDIFSVDVTGKVASHAPNITAEQREMLDDAIAGAMETVETVCDIKDMFPKLIKDQFNAVVTRIQALYKEIHKHKEVAHYLTLKDFD